MVPEGIDDLPIIQKGHDAYRTTLHSNFDTKLLCIFFWLIMQIYGANGL